MIGKFLILLINCVVRVPKLLQTISTLHILTVFYITETRIGIILIVFSSLFAFVSTKDRDTLIEQSGNAKIL